MFDHCLEKQERIRELFQGCATLALKYQKIIDLGKRELFFDEQFKTQENLVPGCQSIMYLLTTVDELGYLHFQVESDALISKGLAYLLIEVYDGELPETVLKCPPQYLHDLEIAASLTPGRANGLASLYNKMKQDALKIYIQRASQ